MLQRVLFGITALLGSLPAVGQGSDTAFNSSCVRTPNYSYSISVPSLEKVDFKNFRVFYQPGDSSDRGVVLRDGKYSKRDQGGYEEVILEYVEVFKPSTEAEQHALISLHWTDCGGSCTTLGRIQVFTLRDSHPTIVQQIEYDRHAEGTGATFNSMTGHLDVVARADDHSPNCCPMHLDIMRFDWNGKRFVPKASKTVTSIESETESIDPH
ncbi:MAG TPA: hypothetical protein VE377_20165 [Candidatus Dormibacteraeota bacterium]|nr:hypothetical protein [Candidatus Dormibacteraeota bacterium]